MPISTTSLSTMDRLSTDVASVAESGAVTTEMASTETTEEQELDSQDGHGDTPLHRAVAMLCETPLLEGTRAEGASRLDDCLHHGTSREVEGFHVDVLRCAHRLHNALGLMPIHVAAAHGNAAVCEALLKAGAPINARSLRRDPLVHARFCNQPRWGTRDATGEITEKEVAHKTALHFAVGLLRDEKEGDKDKETELDLSLVRLLLRFGADVNAFDFHGQTPFHIAVVAGMHEVVDLLANAGADLSTSCRSFGMKNTALHLAVLLKDVRLIKLLTGYGASVDAIGRDGWTPLCLAARSGSLEVAKALLEARADVFALSGNGKSPLDIATLNSKHKTSPVLELLQLEVSAAVLEIAMTWYRQRRSREA